MLLNGGEKAKIKNIVMAIKGLYPDILKIVNKPKYDKNQNSIDELFDCNKRVFMWLAHLSTTLINSNEVLIQGFDALQESNRFTSVKVGEHKKVELLIKSIELIPTIQDELIKIVDNDNTQRDRVLKDIMDELGIENPNKKKKKDKKFSSMSFDDWFNDD